MSEGMAISVNTLAVRKDQPIGVETFVRNVIGSLDLGDLTLRVFLRRGVDIGHALGMEFVARHPRLTVRNLWVGPTWFRIPLEMFFLSWLCRSDDVVLSVNNFGPLWGKRGQRRIVIIHDVWFMTENCESSRLSRWVFKTLVKIQLSTTHLVVTVSEFSRKEISRYFGVGEEEIVVAENCLPDIQSPDRKRDEGLRQDYFLIVASDRRNKNLNRALSGFREYLSSAEHPVKSLVVGRYSEEFLNAIRREFADLGEYLQLEGYVSDKRYNELLSACRGMVFPSLYEGYGIPVIEAIAAGKPVLVSANTACAELAGEVAVVVKGTDIDDIARGFKRLEGLDLKPVRPIMESLVERCADCHKPAGRLREAILTTCAESGDHT